MIRSTDPILGPSRGNALQFLSVFIGPDQKDQDYVMGVSKWATVAGVDNACVYVQFCQECTDPGNDSPGTSVRWNRDNNPAGLAIPLDTTKQPFTINDGDEAARLHIQCLYSLVTGKIHPGVPIPTQWVGWFPSVWLPKVTDANAPKVTTLADLNIRYMGSDGDSHATWAWDTAYLDGLLAYAAKWLPNVPDYAVKPTTYVRPSGVPGPQLVKTTKTVTPRKVAALDAPATGPDVPAGTPVTITRALYSGATSSWWLTDDKGSRYPIDAFS